MKYATCHPDRKHHAFGLCKQCYRIKYRKENSKRLKAFRKATKLERKEYDHRRYMAHRDVVIARTKAYAKKHPDKFNNYSKKYRDTNPDKDALRHKIYNAKNEDMIKIRVKKYAERNKNKIAARMHKYYVNNPEKERTKRLKKYGLTSKDYDKMFDSQHGVCAICGSDNKGKRLHVDHNHETGKVRELLCTACNVGLGSMKDSEEILEKALDYLRKHKNG